MTARGVFAEFLVGSVLGIVKEVRPSGWVDFNLRYGGRKIEVKFATYPHGNELWEFDENGLMKRRDASINDYKIDESERKFRWTR